MPEDQFAHFDNDVEVPEEIDPQYEIGSDVPVYPAASSPVADSLAYIPASKLSANAEMQSMQDHLNREAHIEGVVSRLADEDVDNRGWFVVDGNDVICRTHFIVFLFVGLLCGAAIGTLLAIVTS